MKNKIALFVLLPMLQFCEPVKTESTIIVKQDPGGSAPIEATPAPKAGIALPVTPACPALFSVSKHSSQWLCTTGCTLPFNMISLGTAPHTTGFSPSGLDLIVSFGIYDIAHPGLRTLNQTQALYTGDQERPLNGDILDVVTTTYTDTVTTRYTFTVKCDQILINGIVYDYFD